jgi:hypothetical protein
MSGRGQQVAAERASAAGRTVAAQGRSRARVASVMINRALTALGALPALSKPCTAALRAPKAGFCLSPCSFLAEDSGAKLRDLLRRRKK